jgi:hypothetical protein
MKPDARQLLRDLKAAALLGNPEAVNLALDGLLAFPGVAANDRLPEPLLEKVILPVGEALTPLPTRLVLPLLGHRLAAGRAIGAVALAHQFLSGQTSVLQHLSKAAGDPRAEVRAALGKALLAGGKKDAEKLRPLVTAWLEQPAPRPRHTALICLPALAENIGEGTIELLELLGSDLEEEVGAALVETLNALARAGLADPVLGLLARWGAQPRANAWVICRVLSAAWAADHPQEVAAILRSLSSQDGAENDVNHALRALERHGAAIRI